MTLPVEYDVASIEEELNRLTQRLDDLYTLVHIVPRETAPADPKDGYLAISDGTGSGFDAVSGAGLYRYNGSSWTFIG